MRRLCSLLRGLPPDALLRTPEPDRVHDRWDLKTELLAQILEMTSVGVAERKVKEPVKIPRPAHLTRKRPSRDGGTKGAVALLAATARPGR